MSTPIALPGFEDTLSLEADIVLTPSWAAFAIIQHFQPAGMVLDPAEGEGAFSGLMEGCETCEIRKGKDFFDWDEKVDWIITNPPWSLYAPFLRHAMEVSRNIVFLAPANKPFNSMSLLEAVLKWGGLREMLLMGTGASMKFPVGYAMAAIHYEKDWRGGMSITQCTR